MKSLASRINESFLNEEYLDEIEALKAYRGDPNWEIAKKHKLKEGIPYKTAWKDVVKVV